MMTLDILAPVQARLNEAAALEAEVERLRARIAELESRREDRPAANRIMKTSEVTALTGMAKSTLFNRVNNGTFPPRFKPEGAELAIGWLESDVRAWMDRNTSY